MSAPSKLSAESFLGVVKQSALIDTDLLKRTWKELKDQGTRLDESRQIADEFVARNLLTRWQADKLLQGRHKGFFLGKYRLLSHLGSGGMSAVYLAEHVLMRRRVAIKVLPKARVNDSSYLERFHREAQAVAALDHRNIVRAYDVDSEDNVHFLVMEYVPGKSLHELVARNGPLDFVSAAEYMRQAAEGLQHAHRIGMVHRDIKPGNLLLDEKGTVKLLDLGLARFFDDKEENSLTVKHDEKVLGTADYLSPEQALDSHNVDIRSDIYSLGCTLYYLLTGGPPFPDGTLAQRLMAHQSKQPRPVQEKRSDIPASLVAILEKMMSKKPEDRYQTARDAAQAMLDWLNANGGSAWAKLNPSVAGSSQMFGSPVGAGSASNVLASDGSGPLAVDAAFMNAITASPLGDSTQPAGGAVGANPFAPAAPTTAGFAAAQETAADPDLAAFFSHLADEGSSRITRSAGSAPPLPVEPAAKVAAPIEPDLEATLTAAQLSSPLDELESPVSEMRWPTDEPVSFEPAGENSAEFAPTLLAPSVDASTPAPATAIPVAQTVAAARPPVAARVVAPVQAPQIPVARPVSGPPVATPVTAPLAKKPPLSRPAIIGIASAAVVVLGVAGFLIFGRGGGSADSASNGKKGKPPVDNDGSGTDKPSKKPSPLPERGEYIVGPAGKFKTIGAALAEIKKHPNNKSRKAVQIIKVAGGQAYSERIVLDETWPRGIQIVAEPGTPPVLAPPGPEPIVMLRPAVGSKKEVSNFRLEGFHLDAAGKEVAVELAEWVLGARFQQIEMTGFAKAGVHISGAQTYGDERERNVFENVTFRNAVPAAVGMLFTRKTTEPRYVRIHQCRFLGPFDCGVKVESDAIGIDISESIFFQNVTGVKFIGADRMWKDVVFGANTFYENDRGIVFTNMPGPQSNGLGFYNNLFFGSKTADAVVEKDLKITDFLAMYRTTPGGSGYNWTTRKRAEPAKPEEINYLFETIGGEFGREDVQFMSTDPASPDFLAPATGSPHRQKGTLDPKKYGAQIGAVRVK
jgi:serine/threonine protein kinase